jgi:hypothetical protein
VGERLALRLPRRLPAPAALRSAAAAAAPAPGGAVDLPAAALLRTGAAVSVRCRRVGEALPPAP